MAFLYANPDVPRHVLILFSGNYKAPAGLPAKLRELGVLLTVLDLVNVHLYGQDLLDDGVWCVIKNPLACAEFGLLSVAAPCSTFSVAMTLPMHAQVVSNGSLDV